MGRAILNKHKGKKHSKAAIMLQIRNSYQRKVKMWRKTFMLINGLKTQLELLNTIINIKVKYRKRKQFAKAISDIKWNQKDKSWNDFN